MRRDSQPSHPVVFVTTSWLGIFDGCSRLRAHPNMGRLKQPHCWTRGAGIPAAPLYCGLSDRGTCSRNFARIFHGEQDCPCGLKDFILASVRMEVTWRKSHPSTKSPFLS